MTKIIKDTCLAPDHATVGSFFSGFPPPRREPYQVALLTLTYSRLDFNHGAQGQVIFSGLSKQEGETFTSLSVTIADQA